MWITIKFTSLFKVYAGKDTDQVELAEGTTVEQLTEKLSKLYTTLPFDSHQTFFVVNEKIASRDQILADGDVVRIYQALAGG